MLIIGGRGFAKEILEILTQLGKIDSLAFYDDINTYDIKLLYGKFPILQNEQEVNFFSKKIVMNLLWGLATLYYVLNYIKSLKI